MAVERGRAGTLVAAVCLGLASLVAAGKFDQYNTCAKCIGAGYGWSEAKNKCGGYKTRACPQEVPAYPTNNAANFASTEAVQPPPPPPRKPPPPPPPQRRQQQVGKSNVRGGIMRQHQCSGLDCHAPPIDTYGVLPVVGELQRIPWDENDRDFQNTLAKRGMPVILTSSPASHYWKAFKKWSPEYLKKKVTKRLSFAESRGKNFMFYDPNQDPKNQFNGSVKVWKAPTARTWMSVEEFLKHAKSDETRKGGCGSAADSCLYYAKMINEKSPFEPVLKDITPMNFFRVCAGPLDCNAPTASTGDDVTSHVWFGQKGVRSTIHYDESFNYHVQIFGNKRWWFASPDYYTNCYPYPMAHPSTRQCQMEWPLTEEGAKKYPKALYGNGTSSGGPIQLLTADVSAGETLYLPPGWLHATLALSMNAGMNYWSEGFNAQGMWMGVGMKCHEQRQVQTRVSEAEIKLALFTTLLDVLELVYKIDEPRNKPRHKVKGTALGRVFLNHAERYNSKVGDGYRTYGKERGFVPVKKWMKKKDPPKRHFTDCLLKAKMIFQQTVAGRAETLGSDLSRILVSDFMEGLARGVLTNTGVGPFFAEVGNYLREDSFKAR